MPDTLDLSFSRDGGRRRDDSRAHEAGVRAGLERLERSGGLQAAPRLQLASDCLRRGQVRFGAELLAPLVELQANNLAACELMGDLQQAAGNAPKAEVAYRRALEIDLRQPRVLGKLAELFIRATRNEEALALLHEALAQKEDFAPAYFLLSQIHAARGETEQSLTALELAMAFEPANVQFGSAWVLRHAYLAGSGDAELLRAGREWERRYTTHVKPLPLAPVEPLAGRRLRVAYLSPDFRRHATAYFFLPLVKRHDRAAFEVFCYADSPVADDLTAEIRRHAEHWRPVAGRSDAEVAAQIRRDRIDVVVDLAGHFSNPHLTMHALRPADVHVHHVGFCGTTGLSAFDGRLTDGVIEPVDAGCEALSAEPLWRLPEGLHAHDPFDALPPVGPLPALRNGYVTFGSCNAQTKINEPVLSVWLAILQRVPTAHVLIKNLELADAELRRRMMAWFVKRGIAAGRIELVGPQKRPEHLAAFQRIDVHLDTFPYNGAVTTCEALWMGVPVLTVRGHCHRGRVGESLLRRAGETDGVADDGDDYVARAVAWSGQIARLAAERELRRQRIAGSLLADGARYARAVEGALTGLARAATESNRG